MCVTQNLCLELATMGDLKLVERPQNYTLAPGDTKVRAAGIHVSCIETHGLGCSPRAYAYLAYPHMIWCTRT